jgi:hypothetical protein
LLGARVSNSHPGIEISTSTVEQALPVVAAPLAPPVGEQLDFAPEPDRAAAGVRSRVERPPRP